MFVNICCCFFLALIKPVLLLIFMKHKIFFSWQADTQTSIGRNFIRTALQEACSMIEVSPTVQESDRELGLVVDSDTMGVAGQPSIVETIFRKIDDSSIYVADVTFVGRSLNPKKLRYLTANAETAKPKIKMLPNPNVMIEYGWALKTKPSTNIIPIMNAAFGAPSETSLPFNIRHLRWPIAYYLPITATAEEKRQAQGKLIKNLRAAIQSSLDTIAEEGETGHFPEAQVKDRPGQFWVTADPVGYADDFTSGSKEIFFRDRGPLWWFRVIPAKAPKKLFDVATLKEIIHRNPPLLHPITPNGGWSYFRSGAGAGVYVPERVTYQDGSLSEANSLAYIFNTGEIWAAEVFTTQHFYYIEMVQQLAQVLKNYTSLISSLGIPSPYRWEIGVSGVRGVGLTYPPPPGQSWFSSVKFVCALDTVVESGTYTSDEVAPSVILPFFKRLFDSCGVSWPDYL